MTLTPEMIEDAKAHREELGCPFTETGWKRFVKRCERYHAEGYDLEELIDRMVNGGWRTVYKHEDCKHARRQRETTVTNLADVKVDKVIAAEALKAMRQKAR